jgi:hypothetical protein
MKTLGAAIDVHGSWGTDLPNRFTTRLLRSNSIGKVSNMFTRLPMQIYYKGALLSSVYLRRALNIADLSSRNTNLRNLRLRLFP